MITLSHLQLLSPGWLALALVPVLLMLLRRNRRRRLLSYADPELRPWVILPGDGRRSRWRDILLLTGWMLLALAMADPRVPATTEAGAENRADHPLPVMVVLDASPAMRADDVTPTRGERAQRLISDLVPRLSGERLGLVVYSAEAGRLLPPTRDTGLLTHYFKLAPEALAQRPGSNLASALRLAASEPGLDGGAVLLLTAADSRSFRGERGNAVFAAARELADRDIGLFTLVLAKQEGAPLRNELGETLYDDNGQAWISRPDLAAIRALTRLADGRWQQVSNNRIDVAALAEFLATRPLPDEGAPAAVSERQPLFAWLLLPALLLLLAARYPGRGTGRSTAATWLLAPGLAMVLAGLPSEQATAQNNEQVGETGQAWRSWEAGDYASAQLDYSRLKGHDARFGEGAAAYRREDFAHARDQFQMALLLATTTADRADATFNLGNALFQLGRFAAARDAYAEVLRLRPDDQGAARNHYLASQRLAQLQERVQDEEPPGRRPTDAARYEEPEESEFPSEEQGGPLEAIGADAGSGPSGRAGEEDEPYRFDARALDSARKKLELVRDEPTRLIGDLIHQQAIRRGEAAQ
ncbi:MAG: VWA domain-containing protein [Halothiobacillaceae bacterium]